MKNILSALVLLSLLAMPTLTIQAQTPPTGMISVSWEELTSADFVKATHLSQGLCILPMGVVEKHGQHLPLGTDVFIARELSLLAARTEYAVVSPFGTPARSLRRATSRDHFLQSSCFSLLDETCREISRNGFKKSCWSTATAATPT